MLAVCVGKTWANYNCELGERLGALLFQNFLNVSGANVAPWIPVILSEKEWRLAQKQKPGWLLSQSVESTWKSCDVES